MASPPNTPTIVVAGDICVDWFAYEVAAGTSRSGTAMPGSAATVDAPPAAPPETSQNWRLVEGMQMMARPGGSLLLARMVEQAIGTEVLAQQVSGLENIPPDDIIHSNVELAPRAPGPPGGPGPRVYRVKAFWGFNGPERGVPNLRPVAGDDPRADLVVLDDGGNGFRDASGVWPAALGAKGGKPWVVLKMSRPLAQGALWESLERDHQDRLIVIVAANDLRQEGANVSRRLSWERTATEFVWQMAHNEGLKRLAQCAFLVVRFGLDGAICYEGRLTPPRATLYYDPRVAEDGFFEETDGRMVGYASAFTAVVAAALARGGIEALPHGIEEGIRASRRLLSLGFGSSPRRAPYPPASIFKPIGSASPCERPLANVVLPTPVPAGWSILSALSTSRLEELAKAIVRDGDASALARTQDGASGAVESVAVPVARFGRLKTVDRNEIESLRSIRNLIDRYLSNDRAKRPLSVAVFGQPGSGKSFAVTQVAKSVAGREIERLLFNLAQFRSPDDLVPCFHAVRDVVLKGEKVPLVFFDEFDSDLEGKLGWLKYFLAPMQDGEFKDGEAMHPIGKAVFVFAGGTSPTFADFVGGAGSSTFVDAKGPDFVSRLRGYVDILGPNQVGPTDRFFTIRRAVLLRSMLEEGASKCVHRDRLAIDEAVLHALLKTPVYKHGARSIEAIIDMSMLHRRRSFEQAALPPTAQLELHVDAEVFQWLLAMFGPVRDRIAYEIHERYRRDHRHEMKPGDAAMEPWETLNDDLKESNRRQAEHIPVKLRAIGCTLVPVVGRDAAEAEISEDEFERLAEMEHDRFVAERRLEGWQPGPRNTVTRTSPYLVPWHAKPTAIQDYDRKTVSVIPKVLAKAGFEIIRRPGLAAGAPTPAEPPVVVRRNRPTGGRRRAGSARRTSR